MAYFDWNATTPMRRAALEAWREVSETAWGNASAVHRQGARAKVILEESRDRVARIMGVSREQVVFTSGATESCNAFIREAARRARPDREIWISAVEHPAVREAALHFWGRERVRPVPVTRDGLIDVDALSGLLSTSRPALVCVMAANNETGIIQPVDKVLGHCRAAGVDLFCDAVQWMGKVPGAPVQWGCLAGVAVGAHKFGGPKGTGCLITGPEWTGLRAQCGGGQEWGSRAGTEDVAGIAAMVAALEDSVSSAGGYSAEPRDAFEKALLGCWPDAVVHGKSAPRLWNTSLVSLPRFASARWIARLDKRGFSVSTGAACSAGKKGPSMVMQAMGVDDSTARRTLRISAGWSTQPSDWRDLLTALQEIHDDLNQEQSSGPGVVIEI